MKANDFMHKNRPTPNYKALTRWFPGAADGDRTRVSSLEVRSEHFGQLNYQRVLELRLPRFRSHYLTIPHTVATDGKW